MIRTLHGYFLRELVKTFLMTVATLTLLLVMGGGVANIFRAEGLGAQEMGKLFAYFTPVAVTMVLPVAALFSTAISYGRASADNEITACRAAGINVHRLLLSASLLGLFVSVCTYFAWNFMIPKLSGLVEALTRKDLPAIVIGQFQHNQALTFGKYRICADDFQALENERRPEGAQEGHTYLWLSGVSFLEMEDEEVMRYGTADATLIDFDRTAQFPSVEVQLINVRTFDVQRSQAISFERQVLGPFEIPMPLKRKMKFQNLPTLQEYVRNPKLIPEVSDLMFRVKRQMMEQFLFRDIREQIERGEYKLVGPDVTYTITTSKPLAIVPSSNEPEILDVKVNEQRRTGEQRELRAGKARVELKNTMDRERPNIQFELTDGVTIRQIPSGPDDRAVSRLKQPLDQAPFLDQPSLKAQLEAFDPDQVLDPAVPMTELTEKLKLARKQLIERMQRFQSEVTGEIHFRASYAASAIAVILIGAMLGIIMRGGQVLTAFGISCVPTAFVVIASIVGRNLAEQPGKEFASLAVMWGATALLYVAATVIGTKVLQR
jgi:lipopolysaccharide export LptBFGC system permease protein LptF